jgi:hypothetical protein
MAKQTINIGTSANSGTGDPLRTAFTKSNENFTELYNRSVFSGSYTDLTNKPTLFDGNYNSLSNKPTLFSGSYTDLTNKPTIPTDVNQLADADSLLGAADLGAFKIQGNTLGTSDEGNSWGGSDMNLSPNGEGNTWIYIPNDANAVAGASFVIGNNTNAGGGIQLNAGGNNWTFASNGDLTAPGDITTGAIGGRFIQDCDDGNTSIRWINVNQGSSSTQLLRMYTGDPKLDTDIERAQIKLNWDQTENLSGLTIRTFDQTDSNNEVNHDWLFKGDGILQLPAGGDIVDVEGNSVLNPVNTVNPLYLMANVDGNISTSTDGTTWSSSIDTGIGIGTVAIGPNKIVYTRADVNQDANNTGLYSSSRPSIPPTLIEGTNGNPGGDLYWLNVEYFEGATYPWVAVGYQDSDLKRPTLIYSSDGISWDFADINLESAYNTTNLEFTDIAYGNGYYVITARSDTNISGGMWFTQDLTETMAVSTNQVSGLDANFKFVEYFTEQNGFYKWNAVATNNQWWASSLDDPSVFVTGESSEGWDNLFDEDGLAGIIEDETGLANVTIEEFASGQINGNSYWMASSGSGHIVWWPNAPVGPFVSIPNPYTSTINDIIRGTTTRISFSTSNNFTASGEKIIISGVTSEDASEPGTSNQSYNGTFYIKNNGGDYELYTDQTLTTPWDTSTHWPVTDPTNGTLTWSHGTYIDSLGFANNAFYAANDDEEIFKGQFGEGLYWTKVDDKNNSLEYWNDFAYYPEFGYGTNNELTNGVQTLTLENDGSVTLPAGGTITEGLVTSNPTIQLTPASPTVASQKLVIKGGASYSVDNNGIYLTWNEINPQVSDTVTIYVGANSYANQTIYWWIHPAEANIADPGFGIVEIDGSGNGSFTFTVDSNDYEFTVRVSPEEDNYDPASIGVETLVFNADAPVYGDNHLHLTTGDLTETSIFLGTDNHNIRTTVNGGIEITTPDESNNVWRFDTAGVMTVPRDGIIQSVDNNGRLRSELRLDQGSDITRLSGWSSPNSISFTTSDWTTGTYTNNAGSGAIEFTGAENIVSWLNANGYADRFFFTVNGGPQMESTGWGGGASNITFNVATPPLTSPTTVTSFSIYYQFESRLDIDTDDQEFYILSTNNFLRLETRQSGNIQIRSVDDLDIVGDGIVTLRNNSATEGIQIRTDDGDHIWNFGVNGNTTFPGALVKSTVAKTGVVYPTTTGTAETLSLSPSISGLTDGTYGPFTLGVVTFSVLVVGGIINGITNLTSTGDVTVGDNLGTINSGDIGGIPGATSITITVSNVVQATPTSLDLTKSINKLTDGTYSLADGVEGQIMYLVRSPDTNSLDVFVNVANGEGENPLYPFNKYNSDETAVVPNDGICTLIFTDGSWKQTGGLWD